ncbi:MAG: hypothetical protein RIC14_05570 [Filomicrobium sp.]
MRPTSDIHILAFWGNALGYITDLFDEDGNDILEDENLEEAEAAYWFCMEGADAGQHFILDIDKLDLVTLH